MIYILSWTTKKNQKTFSRHLHSTLTKIQGLFKTVQTLSQHFLFSYLKPPPPSPPPLSPRQTGAYPIERTGRQ